MTLLGIWIKLVTLCSKALGHFIMLEEWTVRPVVKCLIYAQNGVSVAAKRWSPY